MAVRWQITPIERIAVPREPQVQEESEREPDRAPEIPLSSILGEFEFDLRFAKADDLRKKYSIYLSPRAKEPVWTIPNSCPGETVPPPKEGKRTETVATRISRYTYLRLKRIAKNSGISTEDVIASVLDDWIARCELRQMPEFEKLKTRR